MSNDKHLLPIESNILPKGTQTGQTLQWNNDYKKWTVTDTTYGSWYIFKDNDSTTLPSVFNPSDLMYFYRKGDYLYYNIENVEYKLGDIDEHEIDTTIRGVLAEPGGADDQITAIELELYTPTTGLVAQVNDIQNVLYTPVTGLVSQTDNLYDIVFGSSGLQTQINNSYNTIFDSGGLIDVSNQNIIDINAVNEYMNTVNTVIKLSSATDDIIISSYNLPNTNQQKIMLNPRANSNSVSSSNIINIGNSDGFDSSNNLIIGFNMKLHNNSFNNVLTGVDIFANYSKTNSISDNTIFGSNVFKYVTSLSSFSGNIMLGTNTSQNLTQLNNFNNNIVIGANHFGQASLVQLDFNNNIIIGQNLILNNTSMENCIVIGFNFTFTNETLLNSTYISNIYGSTLTTGIAVYSSPNNQLATSVSNAIYKNQIIPIDQNIINKFLSLDIIKFNYKKDNIVQYGYYTQDFEKHGLYDFLLYENNEAYAIKTHFIVPILLELIKKNKNRINTIKSRFEQIKNNYNT